MASPEELLRSARGQYLVDEALQLAGIASGTPASSLLNTKRGARVLADALRIAYPIMQARREFMAADQMIYLLEYHPRLRHVELLEEDVDVAPSPPARTKKKRASARAPRGNQKRPRGARRRAKDGKG